MSLVMEDWQRHPTLYTVTNNKFIVIYTGYDYDEALKAMAPYPDGSCVISAEQAITLQVGSQCPW